MVKAIKPDTYKVLKVEIDKRGIKTKFIASKAGIPASYLSQLLNGSREMSTDVALALIKQLELPVENFLR